MISLNKIIQAKRTISGFVYKTPFAYSAKLSLASGALIYLKEENLQRTGAYKIRGKCGQSRPRRSYFSARV